MPDVDVVDIGGLFDGGSTAATDTAIWDALRRTGGMVIRGFPGADRIDSWAHEGLTFFDLPEDRRRRLAVAMEEPGNPNRYRGYHPMPPGTTFKNNYLDIGPDDPAPGPDLAGMDILTEPTPWPDPEPSSGWGTAVRTCYAHLNEVAQTFMASVGRSAGFDAQAIAARFHGSHSTLRFLDYPNSDPAAHDGIAALRHVDASGLSLLWQAQPGLQAEAPDGTWHDIPMMRDCISVHVGTVMAGLTRGAVPATPHRVLAGQGRRQSMGFFLEPALTAPITPADVPLDRTGVSDTYGWLLLKTLSARDKYRALVPEPA